MSEVHFCDECFEYKNTKDEIEHCKSLHHPIHKAVRKIKAELKEEWKKLGKKSGTTIEQKEEAKKRINALEEIAGMDLTDWGKQDESSLTKKIYDFLMSKKIELVISKDDSSQVYAKIDSGGHVEVINLDSYDAISWLMYNHRKSTGEFYSEDEYKNAIKHVKAGSLYEGSKKESVYNRIAQVNTKENGLTIYYDLGTPGWDFVRITGQGYLILQYTEHFPVFERVSGLAEQAFPDELSKREDPLEELCDLLRVETGPLFKVHLIHFFFQNQETPFMFFDGEHGSTKTTLTQMIKKTVDPTSSNLGSFPTDKKDLQSVISNTYMPVFDNVSGFNQSISDILCRALSGDQIAKRKLYTDNAPFIKSYSQKKFVFNGISPSIEFPDFNDRTIYYRTTYIPENQKLPKSKLWDKYDELLPHVLNQIFKIISDAIKLYESVGSKVQSKSRLADFERWGETISQVMGYKPGEFLDAYYQKRDEIAVKDNDSFPIISAINYFMNERKLDSYEDRTTKLWNELTTIASDSLNIDIKDRHSKWPKKPNLLSQQINRLKEQLRREGYDVEVYTCTKSDTDWHNRSVTRITKISAQNSPNDPDHPDHPDQTENPSQNNDKSGKDVTNDPDHDPDQITRDSTPKSDSGQDGRGGRDDFMEIGKKYTHWSCQCLSDNPEIFPMGEPDYNESSMKGHEKRGHTVKKFTQKEADEFSA